MHIFKATTYHARILSDMFFNYHQHLSIFDVTSRRRKVYCVIKRLCYLNIIADIKNQFCYMCVDNKKLVGQFTLLSPNEYREPISTIIYNTGLPVLWQSTHFLLNWSFPLVGAIMKNLSDSHELVDNYMLDKFWFLDQVSLDKTSNNDIFQKIMNQIKNIVGTNGGEGIVLVTNSLSQLHQFLDNGFAIVNSSAVSNHKHTIKTWLLSYQLPVN